MAATLHRRTTFTPVFDSISIDDIVVRAAFALARLRLLLNALLLALRTEFRVEAANESVNVLHNHGVFKQQILVNVDHISIGVALLDVDLGFVEELVDEHAVVNACHH